MLPLTFAPASHPDPALCSPPPGPLTHPAFTRAGGRRPLPETPRGTRHRDPHSTLVQEAAFTPARSVDAQGDAQGGKPVGSSGCLLGESNAEPEMDVQPPLCLKEIVPPGRGSQECDGLLQDAGLRKVSLISPSVEILLDVKIAGLVGGPWRSNAQLRLKRINRWERQESVPRRPQVHTRCRPLSSSQLHPRDLVSGGQTRAGVQCGAERRKGDCRGTTAKPRPQGGSAELGFDPPLWCGGPRGGGEALPPIPHAPTPRKALILDRCLPPGAIV